MIKDCVGMYSQLAKAVNEFFDEFLDSLPESLKKLIPLIPPIEIWRNARQIHTPEELARFKKEDPDYDPDNSGGEVWKGKIMLYTKTSNLSTDSSLKVEHFKHVCLHELGHCFYDYTKRKRSLRVKKWDQSREKDGDGRRIFFDYREDLIGNFGFHHEKTRREDFAESFAYFFKFAANFPNRFVFLQKLIESL